MRNFIIVLNIRSKNKKNYFIYLYIFFTYIYILVQSINKIINIQLNFSYFYSIIINFSNILLIIYLSHIFFHRLDRILVNQILVNKRTILQLLDHRIERLTVFLVLSLAHHFSIFNKFHLQLRLYELYFLKHHWSNVETNLPNSPPSNNLEVLL